MAQASSTVGERKQLVGLCTLLVGKGRFGGRSGGAPFSSLPQPSCWRVNCIVVTKKAHKKRVFKAPEEALHA